MKIAGVVRQVNDGDGSVYRLRQELITLHAAEEWFVEHFLRNR